MRDLLFFGAFVILVSTVAACASTVDSSNGSSAGTGGGAGASSCPDAIPPDGTPCPTGGLSCPFDSQSECSVTHEVSTCGAEGWQRSQTVVDTCCPVGPPIVGHACMLGGPPDGGPELCTYATDTGCGSSSVTYTCVDGQWTLLAAPTPPC